MGMVLLVRHGQASFGADDYDVLSPTGWEQGRHLGAYLTERGITPTAVLRGSMRRHRETWEAMCERGGDWPDDVVDADWDEFDHVSIVDAFLGKPAEPMDRRGFQEVFEKATTAWAAGEVDGAETFAAFVARSRAALARATALAGPGQCVVVVTSGGPIGVCAAALTDPGADDVTLARMWQRFNTVVGNANVSRVVVGSTGPRLLTFNEGAHLAGDLVTYR